MEKKGWRLACASAIGTSHEASCLPCQDCLGHAVVEAADGEVLIVAVADGAGSASRSDIGSRVSVQTLIERISVYLREGGAVGKIDRETAIGWIGDVIEALEETASSEGEPRREYSCTLLATIAGQSSTAFLQIGDGAIVVSHGPLDGWSYVFWPQHGEFANTTNFVLSDNAPSALEVEVADRRIDEFAMFTDGIEKLVLHDASRTVHGTFFDAMFPPVRKVSQSGMDGALSEGLARYLASPAICDRTDDDKSLVLATRVVNHGASA